MSLRDYSEVLDIGSIWQTRRRGSLNIVLYITNLDLSSDARKKHVPQVVFSDGQHVLSTSIDRFISRREYIRTDKDVANMLYDALAMPITLKAQSPSFLLDEEADVDDETGIYVGDDEDTYEGPQNFTYDDYYPQTPAAISAHQQEETEKEVESIIEEQPLQDVIEQEASVSITASKQEEPFYQEEPIYQEECPVKLFVDDEELTSVIGYSQTMIDSGIVHEIRFGDKDVINKIVDASVESYHLTLGSMSIDFIPEDLLNAYAGYDHGQVFYAAMLLEANEEDEDIAEEDNAEEQEDTNLVVDSAKPIILSGEITQTEPQQEQAIAENEEEVQSLDLFEDMPEEQKTLADINEVQTQESDQAIEATQEDQDSLADEALDENLEENELTTDESLDTVVAESTFSNSLVADDQDQVEAMESELSQNSDSAIFVYNKQVEENNALADRLEAALNNSEGEEENGSNPNTTTVEERSA